MAWKIELERSAERELDKLNPRIASRILSFLQDRLAPLAISFAAMIPFGILLLALGVSG